MARMNLGERAYEERKVLHRDEAADTGDDTMLGREAELPSQRLRIQARRKAIQVDPVRDVGHALGRHAPLLDQDSLDIGGDRGEARDVPRQEALRAQAPLDRGLLLVSVLPVDDHRHARDLGRDHHIEEGGPVVRVHDVRALLPEERDQLGEEGEVDPPLLPQHHHGGVRVHERKRVLHGHL